MYFEGDLCLGYTQAEIETFFGDDYSAVADSECDIQCPLDDEVNCGGSTGRGYIYEKPKTNTLEYSGECERSGTDDY